MILTNDQIVQARDAGDIYIEPFDGNQVQGATYDFRVGKQGATTSTKKLIDIEEAGYLLLAPGDFAIITVLEELRIGPQYAARFGLRSKYARDGVVATTGPQIDPGYHGRLILGLTNLTPRPVSVPYKDDLVSVEFHKLEKPSTKPYAGPYQDKLELRPEDISAVVEAEAMALSEVLTTLASLSTNVAKLGEDLKSLTNEVRILTGDVATLKWAVPLIVAIGMAVVGIVVAVG